MSSTTSSHDGSSKSTTLATTKDKMKVQQRMIDLTARELQSTRLSSQAIAESSPGNALEENILLVENKLMKLFSRQLMHKHIYIQEYRSQEKATNDNLLGIKEELDQLISLQMFLTVAGIEERTTKRLLANEEHLSVDTLFLMSPQELQQLFLRLDISSSDCHKLVSLLDLMSHYYGEAIIPAEKWERGEKPTAEAYDIRRNSSSGRLNSLTSLDSRKDSSSSHTISPPAGNYCSRSSTPLTPGTPSSQTQSPFLGLPHQNSVPVLPTHMTNEHSFKRSNSSSGSGFTTLMDLQNQHLSSSSSSINSDHHEPVAPPPPLPTNNANNRAKRKLGHTRSHSNPPLANLVLPEAVPEHSVVPDYRSPSPPYYNSTAPPTRTGSHSSIVQNNVNSTSAKSHPQVRRLMANTSHVFTRSVSTDLGGEMNPEPPARSNSEASGVQSSSPRQRRLSKETGTSASMVDLPLIRCSDQIDQNEYGFPQSGKSHSVPRLANLVVNVDNGQLNHSISVPTSPRLPSNYNPTGVIGHKIDHRFVNNLFFGVHECDYCKKTLVMNGSKCRYCKYKCHKNCAKLAPPTCGLPRDFLNYARRHKHLLMSPSYENVFQVQNNTNTTTPSMVTPPKSGLTSSGEYQSVINQAPPPSETKSDDNNTFVIQDLNREPSNSQYSPVISARRYQLHPPPPSSPSHENGRVFGYQTSRLEVPQLHPSPLHTHHHHPHSTSSSPSTSTHSSPCLTPVSPRSPLEPLHMDYPSYTSGYSSVPVILTDDSETDEDYDSNHSDVSGESVENLVNISDQSHINGDGSHSLRPTPQVILAQSLPNLLLSDEQIHSATSSVLDSTSGGMYATSEDNLQSWFNPRKDSLVATMSTADSKTSTLVGSIMEDDDASSFAESEHLGSQGGVDEEFRIKVGHRNSVVDEWIIPYDDLRLVERIGNGAVAEVFKGYWHGEVAVKRFLLPNATPNQIMKFKEEVAVLKKIRHENVALFMGVCLTPPNLAIITSLCRGYTLYKLLHYWSEIFSLERLVNVGRQIAQAMGYLHARGIIHKGLNAKNIFLEKTTDQKEKVVITDMGLSALSSSLWTSENETCLIRFPRTQLYYLPSEIISLVTAYRETQLDYDIYPFNESTDIYAFGTILYELITRKYPFTTDALGFAYEYEVVVFLVGKGHRQHFKSTDIPKQLKDIVWECWDPKASDRPAFTELCERLARLCRKHTPITRSPSHPINLSKSVDNLLFI